MTRQFDVVVEKDSEGYFIATVPALPGCHTQSETVEEGVENIREAIELYMGTLSEDGLPSPTF